MFLPTRSLSRDPSSANPAFCTWGISTVVGKVTIPISFKNGRKAALHLIPAKLPKIRRNKSSEDKTLLAIKLWQSSILGSRVLAHKFFLVFSNSNSENYCATRLFLLIQKLAEIFHALQLWISLPTKKKVAFDTKKS